MAYQWFKHGGGIPEGRPEVVVKASAISIRTSKYFRFP